MARRNKLLVPESRQAVNHLKQQVMNQKGYHANSPDEVKYEVAQDMNVPLKKGYNGQLTSKQAGKVGGQIGGSMVKEIIKMAQKNIAKK